MAFKNSNNLNGGVNLDEAYIRLLPNQSIFLKNLVQNVNQNAGAPSGAGANKYVTTPIESNVSLPITLPSGKSFTIGGYSSEQTNEFYFFVWNINNNHTIWVIDGDTGAISKVYTDTLGLLPFILDPQYFLAEGRVTIELRSYIDPVTKLETNYKFLIFTNNQVRQYYIEVASSIATNSFTTPYFTDSAAFYNPVELIHLGVPTPLSAIGLNTPTPYVSTPTDANLQNLIIRNGWQFRVKFIDIFGRESEHGIISSQYITIVGGGCISTSNGLPRCVNLSFDAGNPLVNIIQVEFRQWRGDDRAGALATGWIVYDTFFKYNNSTSVKWYNRFINPLFTTSGSGITFDSGTNQITYTFCADKNSIPIDPNETSRTEPGVPRISSGVASINKRIALSNNVHGFEPIPQTEINKITYSAQQIGTPPCPPPPDVSVTFYAVVYSPYDNQLQLIRQSYGLVVFGGSDSGGGCTYSTGTHTSSIRLGQVFGDQQNPGFITYLAGTPHKSISQQGNFDPSTGIFTLQGYGLDGSPISFPNYRFQKFTITGVAASKYLARIGSHRATINDPDLQQTSTYVAGVVPMSAITSGGITNAYALNPVKEIEIDLTAGVDVEITDRVFVILDLGDRNSSGAVDGYLYEEPGGAPVEMNPIALTGSELGTPTDAFGSFFTDHNGFYFAASGEITTATIYTDFCDGGGIIPVFAISNGEYSIKHGDGSNSPAGHCWGDNGNWKNQVYLANNSIFSYSATSQPFRSSPYRSAARRVINQQIFQCGSSTIGVPGVPITITRSGGGITNTSGVVSLILHNRYAYRFEVYLSVLALIYSTAPGYDNDDLVFSQKGNCQWTICNSCTFYMPDVLVTYIACTGSPRVTNMPNLNLRVSGDNLEGVQSGNKYQLAFWCFDDIGRHTDPQIAQGNVSVVNVPNINDINPSTSQPYGFLLFSLVANINPSFTVDPIFTKMAFLVSAGIDFTDFISWNADWVQPINVNGTTDFVNPTQLRVYYRSLNEYNKQFNFSTNTQWQIIGTNQDGVSVESPIEGDIVQFIMNGTGEYIPSILQAAITYDKTGAFFTIDYVPEMVGLTNNCLFRIIRPNPNISTEDVALYEQSLVIPLIDGVPQVTGNVTIPYVDSYFIERLFPVPRMIGIPTSINTTVSTFTPAVPAPPGTYPNIPQPNATSPDNFPVTPQPIAYTSSNQDTNIDLFGYGGNNGNSANGVILVANFDDAISVPFYCESPSPADTWGSHIADRGRVGFINTYEQQQRIGTEIALSDALGDRGILNGLSYFESKNVQVFDRNTWGDIQVVLVETSVMLVICDRDHFVVTFNISSVKANPLTGNIESQNTYGIFTAPERKAGTNYGCSAKDINTIRKYAGIVWWLDSTGYLVRHNFSSADSNTDGAGYLGYLLNKISFVNVQNNNPSLNGLTYFIGGIDPHTMMYHLSSVNITEEGTSHGYINTDSQPNITSNETMLFDLFSGQFKGNASYTPEYYGQIAGFYLQKNFLTFKGGIPYRHHGNSIEGSVTYCNFYGTQCEVRATIVVNSIDGKPLPDKVKRFLWVEIYTDQFIQTSPPGAAALLYADIITTDKGQLSRLLVPQWDRRDNFFCAAFLCDLNTPADPNLPIQTGANVILDGDQLQGRYLILSLTNNPSWTGTYFEITDIVTFVNLLEKSGG